MTRGRRRFLRVCATAGFAGLLTMSVASPSSGATTPKQVQFDEVHGEGAWSTFELNTAWANDLATAPSYVNYNYALRGSMLGREDLVQSLGTAEDSPGHLDFAISGVPFTAAELAGVKGGASAFITAPVQVASLAFFVQPPIGGFKSDRAICNPDILDSEDPSLWPDGITDPDSQCVITTPMAGPIRIPWRNLAAMLLGYTGNTTPPLTSWNDPAELEALGLHSTDAVQYSVHLQNPTNSPHVAGRSDPDEVNYQMQTAIRSAAPDVWNAVKNLPPALPWEPVTERLPRNPSGSVTRDGAEQQIDQIGANAQCGNPGGDCQAFVTGGGIAPAAASMSELLKSGFPAAKFFRAEVENAGGEWVGPTVDAIQKAVDKGGAAPLYALTNPVPGAYPLVWVDNLYAPAHGLSAKRTESVATLIRYLATTGQEHEAAVGEGRLPGALVQQSLNAANQLVLSNCVGSDRAIVSSTDPGPLAPPTATAMRSIGNMLHCVTLLPATTTTTTNAAPTSTSTPTTSSITSSSSGSGTDDSGSLGGAVSGDTGSTGGTTAAGADGASGGDGNDGTSGSEQLPGGVTQSASGLLTATKLPLHAPNGSSASDRVATFLLGAALYLLVRKPTARLVRRIAR